MMASPQMYDTGLENLKKAALTVKVRSFLSGNGDLDPADLENPELSLDLQSLIDDPNFEVGEGLFPDLLHHAEKLAGVTGKNDFPHIQNILRPQHQNHPNNHNNNNSNNNGFIRNNPLAYMPQAVHGGSSFQPDSSQSLQVKEEPLDHRMDFNGNAVSSSDPTANYFSTSLSNVTSPSESSSSSGSGGQGYSPNSYGHHLTPATIPDGGMKIGFNGNGKSLHHHHHHHNGHSSKKLKNVDKSSDEYKRRRERNNIAVRKSREKAKIRSRETEERVKILAKENERLQKKIDLLTEELTFLRSFFSNVGGLPEQIHREFNKHLETFQHHNIQTGIHLQ